MSVVLMYEALYEYPATIFVDLNIYKRINILTLKCFVNWCASDRTILLFNQGQKFHLLSKCTLNSYPYR